MHYDLKMELRDFESALENELKISKKLDFQNREISYLSRGFYVKQIKKAFNIFGKDNVHIILSHDLKLDTENTLKKTFNFLHLDFLEHKMKNDIDTNVRKYYSKMKLSTRQRLVKYFKDEIKELEKLIKTDLSIWLN